MPGFESSETRGAVAGRHDTRGAGVSAPAVRNKTVAGAGGPKTAAGKQVTRGNALKHGLTSTKLLPQTLRKRQVNKHRVDLERQFQPANPTESILVAEMARHATMMEVGEEAEGAVLRHGARELSKVILGLASETDDNGADREDAILSAAVSTDALDKFNRYRRGHEKAFFTALNKLREIQSDRRKHEQKSRAEITKRTNSFGTEEACKKHLADRFHRADWRCPHCESAQGSWLRRQKRWQCGACHRQVGLRFGTVMQGSRLPLRVWFWAITRVAPGSENDHLTIDGGPRRSAARNGSQRNEEDHRGDGRERGGRVAGRNRNAEGNAGLPEISVTLEAKLRNELSAPS